MLRGYCAYIAGDLEDVQRLLAKDASRVRCHHAYRKPIQFAVRLTPRGDYQV